MKWKIILVASIEFSNKNDFVRLKRGNVGAVLLVIDYYLTAIFT